MFEESAHGALFLLGCFVGSSEELPFWARGQSWQREGGCDRARAAFQTSNTLWVSTAHRKSAPWGTGTQTIKCRGDFCKSGIAFSALAVCEYYRPSVVLTDITSVMAVSRPFVSNVAIFWFSKTKIVLNADNCCLGSFLSLSFVEEPHFTPFNVTLFNHK